MLTAMQLAIVNELVLLNKQICHLNNLNTQPHTPRGWMIDVYFGNVDQYDTDLPTPF
jgi:hypothetical protein